MNVIAHPQNLRLRYRLERRPSFSVTEWSSVGNTMGEGLGAGLRSLFTY